MRRRSRFESQTFGAVTTTPPGLNLLRLEETLSAAHLRLASTFIEYLRWQVCIERYDRPHTLFYMGPPYWQTEGYGVAFGIEQYEEMAAILGRLKGKAIISLNDHPNIRYTVGGAAKARGPRGALQLGRGGGTNWVVLTIHRGSA